MTRRWFGSRGDKKKSVESFGFPEGIPLEGTRRQGFRGCRRNRRVRKRGHKIGNGGAGRRWLHIAGAQRGRAARRQAKRELGTLSRGGQRGRTRARPAGAAGSGYSPRPQAARAPPRCRPCRSLQLRRAGSAPRPGHLPLPPNRPALPAAARKTRRGSVRVGAGTCAARVLSLPHPAAAAGGSPTRTPPTAAGSETLRGMGAEGAVRRPLRYHGLGVPRPRLLVWAGTSREPSAQAEVTGERCSSSSSPREVAFLTACRPARAPASPPCRWA